jgi:hypothetical protein
LCIAFSSKSRRLLAAGFPVEMLRNGIFQLAAAKVGHIVKGVGLRRASLEHPYYPMRAKKTQLSFMSSHGEKNKMSG